MHIFIFLDVNKFAIAITYYYIMLKCNCNIKKLVLTLSILAGFNLIIEECANLSNIDLSAFLLYNS